MNDYFANAGIFLVKTVVGLVLLAFALRFLFQLMRVDFRNPVSQFIVKVTNPLLVPLRRVIPGLFGIDMASLLLILLIQAAEIYLIGVLVGALVGWSTLAILTVAQLIGFIANIFLFSILIQVIISWVNPGSYNPAVSLLSQLNEPLLRPARRIMPNLGGLDLSPLIVVVFLQLVSMLIVAPLSDWAQTLG